MFNYRLAFSFGVLAAMSCSAIAQESLTESSPPQANALTMEQKLQAYEARFKILEARIAQLEKEKEHPTKKASPRSEGVQKSKNQPQRSVAKKSTRKKLKSQEEWQGDSKGGLVASEEAPLTIPEGFKWNELVKGLTFEGYFRSGYGVSGDGDGNTMEAFKAPGAQSKYRLGNETETYVETAFGYTFPELDLPQGTEFSVHIRPAYVSSNAVGNNDKTSVYIREAYGMAKGVWAAQPEAAFWAGQRFYGRMDVHMIDFYYLDMSGFGGGVENVDLGFAKFSAAWLGGNIDDLVSNGSGLRDEVNGKNSFDFRLTDIDLPGGKGMVWLDLAHSQEALRPNGNNVIVGSSTGAAVGVGYRIPDVCGGYSQTLVQYGVGAAANFRSTQEDFSGVALPADPLTPLLINPNDAWHFRLTQDVVYQPNDRFAVQGTFVWDEFDLGYTGARSTWLSGGARGVYYLNNYFSLALEAGMDHVDGIDTPSGNLYKITFAPQISPKREYFSRPALRLFMTYALWDESLKGFVAPESRGLDTDGFSFGMQVEAWW